MAVDLHTHSRQSDGSDTPAELMANAALARLAAIALTDHDTLAGIGEAQEAADRLGIELVPGTELSLAWDGGGMHLLVLFLAPGGGPLQDRLAELQEARAGRNARMVDRLNELGFDITLEEVNQEAGAGVTGRPHFAAVLVRKGYVTDIPAAFDELLASGRPAYLKRDLLNPEEAIGLARASGGVPILAHPHTLGHDTSEEFAATFERLADAGLVGLECLYPGYDADQRTSLVSTARRFGLVPSGGSDYHGTYKEGLALGTGWEDDLYVDYDVLAELREHAG